MLKDINLYWFHNDASEKDNSLNGHFKDVRINEEMPVISSVKKNLQGCRDKAFKDHCNMK